MQLKVATCIQIATTRISLHIHVEYIKRILLPSTSVHVLGRQLTWPCMFSTSEHLLEDLLEIDSCGDDQQLCQWLEQASSGYQQPVIDYKYIKAKDKRAFHNSNIFLNIGNIQNVQKNCRKLQSSYQKHSN